MLILQLWDLKSANLMRTPTPQCQETLMRLTITIVYLVMTLTFYLNRMIYYHLYDDIQTKVFGLIYVDGKVGIGFLKFNFHSFVRLVLIKDFREVHICEIIYQSIFLFIYLVYISQLRITCITLLCVCLTVFVLNIFTLILCGSWS